MRKLALTSLFLLVFVGCAAPTPQQAKPQRYTAYNIWLHKRPIFCINFKLGGEFIPAGTAVKNIEVSKDTDWPEIRFQIVDTKQYITVRFNESWHPGESVRSYEKKMFTEKNFDSLTDGLSPEEIKSIKNGILTVGMSKRAVLVSYGPPPEHYTKRLSSNEWYYWLNRVRKKKICFDEDEKAQRCGRVPSSNRL